MRVFTSRVTGKAGDTGAFIMNVLIRAALPVLLASSLLSGCATHSDGSAPLNQRTWPICSLIGGLVGGGLGAIESSGWPFTAPHWDCWAVV